MPAIDDLLKVQTDIQVQLCRTIDSLNEKNNAQAKEISELKQKLEPKEVPKGD